MKSKMLKRFIAVVLCMVIVLSGSEYMRAGGFGSEGTEELTGETTDEEIVVTEDTEAGSEEQQPVEVGETSEEEKEEAAPEEEQQQEAESQEEVPAEETQEEAKPIMELTYEDSQINIRVTADEAGNIPEGATLSVAPIERKEIHSDMNAQEKAEAEEMNAQYEATAEKLQEKAENEDYNILGFLAYDISFLDENGDKIEPNGSVSVSMDYKEAAIPEEVKEAQEAGAEVQDVTLMHLEENSQGDVKNVVDMVADENEEAKVQTTEDAEVEKATFMSDSFSTYTLTWTGDLRASQKIYLVDENGVELTVAPEQNSLDVKGEISIADKAPKVTGYVFDRAVVTSSTKNVSTKAFNLSDGYAATKLKTDRGYYGNNVVVKYYYEGWGFAGWYGLDNTKAVCFVYKASARGLTDLDGKSISVDEYNALAEAANNDGENTVPITWKRSKNIYSTADESERLGWNWDTLMNTFGNSWYTEPYEIWDGSRSPEGRTATHYYTYLQQDRITAQNGKLYDSASWKRENNKETFYLFRGTFDLKSMGLTDSADYGKYNYTIKSVIDDDRIYINDNMFVFVYPEGTQITDANCSQYLAFWTGTSNQGSGALATFKTIAGTRATQLEKTALRQITDGWSTEPVEDGAGGIIQNALNKGMGTKFCIDVIASDYAEGGAMYRLKLEATPDETKKDFSFRKVDAENTSKGISDAVFMLTSTTEGGTRYELTSDASGYVKATVAQGTYILKEVSGGRGYLTSGNEWTVEITDKGVTIKEKRKNDTNASLGGNAKDGYYITNTKGTVTPALSEPEHKKTIEQFKNDNYTLSLNVKGAVGQDTAIDILLIVDRSGSMDGTRTKNVNTAIEKLCDALKNSENTYMSVVSFANDARTDVSWKKLDSSFSYKANIGNGGTNWQAGFQTAEKVLQNKISGRENASTYVIFLTDGAPTFYYNQWGGLGGDGQEGYNNMKTCYSFAKSEWNSSTSLKKAKWYVVDATPGGGSTYCTTLEKDINDTKTTSATKITASSTNSTALENAFKTIADSITRPSYTKVSITDTLSKYAEFAEPLNLHVYAQPKDGEKTELTTSQYRLKTFNKATKTISVELLNGAALEKDTVYTMEFDIKPSLEAYYEKETVGYGDTKGDKDTDTNLTKNTSSLKPGFYSNDNASVDYTVNGVDSSADYDYPVLQVEPEKVSHEVEKVWVGTEGPEIQAKLKAQYSTDGETWNDVPAEYPALPQGEALTLTLNGENEWKGSWQNLPKYYYYKGADNKLLRTEIRYTAEEVEVPDNYEASYNDDDQTKTIITNTKNIQDTWKLVKKSSSKSEDGSTLVLSDAKFELSGTTAAGQNVKYIGISGEDGVVSWTDDTGADVETIPEGTYILKETEAPGGYERSSVEWDVVVAKNGIPTITADKAEVKAEVVGDTNGPKTYTYVFENDPVYTLPSTGGIGTLWYTIGGMLLMMAAALILYKNKKYTK